MRIASQGATMDTSVPSAELDAVFYDATRAVTLIVDGAARTFVPIKPIVQQLGLDWSAQYRRIRRDPVLSDVARVICMLSTPSGRRQQYLALPTEYLQGWLFGIQTSHVRPELRTRIAHYKRMCYRILASTFLDESSTPLSLG